ncbi:MAG: hypothetical protein WCB85_00030, partial [Candidatus Dormiibacterota bacterium]
MAILAEEDEASAVDRDHAGTVGAARTARSAVALEGGSPVVRAADRLVHRIELLVEEVSRLRSDNQELRRQVRDAVALLDRAAAAVGEPH